jgi:membrane fusion protein, multidrug efflux system
MKDAIPRSQQMKSRILKFIGILMFLVLSATLGQVRAEQAGGAAFKLVSLDASGGYEGIVEAERQTAIAAQVTGSIVEISVKAGERVKKGQLLVRIDARAAAQTAAAGKAQQASAEASLELARKELEREKQLFAQGYISQAAEDRAEAKFKVAEAQARAQSSMAAEAQTQAGFYTVRAPYAGVVSEVPVVLGDMAMPGRPLLTLYDPAALRVTAHIPQSAASGGFPAATLEISGNEIKPAHIKVLPAIDAGTDTVEVRFSLPPSFSAAPGTFVRVEAGVNAAASSIVRIPLAAVVKRAELTGAYVLNSQNQPMLRQIRLGRTFGPEVEVLSGINPGERVAPDADTALGAAAH